MQDSLIRYWQAYPIIFAEWCFVWKEDFVNKKICIEGFEQERIFCWLAKDKRRGDKGKFSSDHKGEWLNQVKRERLED